MALVLCRAVETCEECKKQICEACADAGDCEGCRQVTSVAAAIAANRVADAADAAKAAETFDADSDSSISALPGPQGGAARGAYHSRDTDPAEDGGVVQHFNFMPPGGGAEASGGDGEEVDLFPPDLMDNLASIVEETGATIVLSSTWRKRGDWQQDVVTAFR